LPEAFEHLRSAARVLEWGLLLGEPSMRIELRHHLEVAAAGLAAERASTEDVEQRRELVTRMAEAGTDIPRYVEADTQFQLRLAQTGGNGVVASLISTIGSLTRVWPTRVLEHAGETASSLAMHQPIVDAVAAGDVEAARHAMEAHMQRATRRLRAALDADRGPARRRERINRPQPRSDSITASSGQSTIHVMRFRTRERTFGAILGRYWRFFSS
jgi:GntR family transcriptional repressor for pyruvate dehydrogenase complex